MQAVGLTPKPVLARHPLNGGAVTPTGRRPVRFEGEFVDTPVYRRADLPAGTRIEGPAIIEQLDSTTVVPPDVVATVDEWLNIRIDLGG
ncbi:MAG: hypothetical protein ABUM26_01950 [Solirubrobacterales bacterium]